MKFFILLFMCLFFSACSSKINNTYDIKDEAHKKCKDLSLNEKSHETKVTVNTTNSLLADVEITEKNDEKYYELKFEDYRKCMDYHKNNELPQKLKEEKQK